MKYGLIKIIFISLLFFNCLGNVSNSAGLVETLQNKMVRFSALSDVEHLVNLIEGQRLVLLGESTHGTSQYYTMRAEISKKLISEKGFSFVAVEGDWASIYRLNLYVKGLYPDKEKKAEDIMRSFDRWPEWMWSNKETAELIEWLKEYNKDRELKDMAGFYGIDVYGHWEAMDRLLEYIGANLAHALEKIRSKTECFTAFGRDEQRYARAIQSGHSGCSGQLDRIVEFLRDNEQVLLVKCKKAYFNALQNAKVLRNAEDFYRLAAKTGPGSWNSRANHFYDTVRRLLEYHGEGSRGVVWAHNTHVGDSRATTMAERDMVNIGMLSREDLGRDSVFIIGFATDSGEVLAGRSWGTPVEKMKIPQGMHGSLENILSQMEHDNFFLIFSGNYPPGHKILDPVRHRAIGVVYNPAFEAGNYVPTVLPERYDALVFIKETNALQMIR